ARPTVTYHAIPSPNSVGYQAQVALNQYGMNKELRDQYIKQFRDWRANPKNLASYEQVVRFPSFDSVVRSLSNEAKDLAEVYKNNNASLLANDRIRRTSSGAVNQARGVQDFAKMLREGWPEGRERLANEALNFHRSYQHIVATPTWEREIVGDEVDIPAFL